MKMKEFISILVAVVLTLLTVNYVVLAFVEPSQPPPGGNVAAPLNIGPGRQIKDGDLTVGNLSASSITLSGDTRFNWPNGGGGGGSSLACTWQGTKCECFEDDSGTVEGKIIFGLTCNAQRQLSGFDIIDFHVTAGNDSCPNAAPPGCDFYIHN